LESSIFVDYWVAEPDGGFFYLPPCTARAPTLLSSPNELGNDQKPTAQNQGKSNYRFGFARKPSWLCVPPRLHDAESRIAFSLS